MNPLIEIFLLNLALTIFLVISIRFSHIRPDLTEVIQVTSKFTPQKLFLIVLAALALVFILLLI